MKTFDEMLADGFIDKYFEKIKKQYLPTDEKGKVNFGILRNMFKSLNGEEFPYRFIYATINGYNSLIDDWSLPSKFRDSQEKIYQMCVENGVTWQELTGFKENGDTIL